MENTKKNSLKTEIIEWIKSIVVALVIGFVVTSFVKPTMVIGESMTNTLQPYDYLLVNKISYKNSLPEYSDIVLAQTEIPLYDNELDIMSRILKKLNLGDEKAYNKIVIKRVIGLPNDIIAIKDGYVYRNGEKLEENYTRDGVTYGGEIYQVPEGHVFLMGDNRQGSSDSRDESIGMIKKEDLIGKVIIRIFPFNKIQTSFLPSVLSFSA